MRIFAWLVLFVLAIALHVNADGDDKKETKYTISGYIKDKSTGEALIGASVYISELKLGATSNVYGFYSISLAEGSYELVYSYLGFTELKKTFNLKLDIREDIELEPASEMLESVEIVGERKDANIRSIEMSVNKIPMKQVKKMPAFLGEVDVLKTIALLPGVISSGDGSTGFHVRGGSTDQNLVLLDGAPVYNPSHFLGFFSVFNSDAIKDFKLYKGGIPAEFGGRLSSVLDIHMNEGNSKRYSVSGGLGLLSSRLTIEGPIWKDRISFIVSGRRTYLDIFTVLSKDTLTQKIQIFFYDMNAKVNFKINENNRIFLSGYFGKDVYAMEDMMDFRYGNGTGTLRWNHLFSSKLFMNSTFIYSKYNYNMNFGLEGFDMDWVSSIEDFNLKTDFTYFLNPKNKIKFGIAGIHHTFDPGKINYSVEGYESQEWKIQNNYAMEYAAYLQNDHQITTLFTATYGLRFSMFQNLGPKTLYSYDKSNPQNYVPNDSVLYGNSETINLYYGLEPRLGLRYILSETSSLKLSYNRMVQYLHLATNTASATPIDYWFPSSKNIKPQIANQIALGYFRNFKKDMFETSAEIYYKHLNNLIDFKDHANTILEEHYEAEIRTGVGYSYGLELYIKKATGKLTGWISYTFSRTRRKIPEINNGDWFFAPYDRTHDFSIVLNYDVTKQFSASISWVFSTAKPRTFPTERYEYQGAIVPVYSERNSTRLKPYHRMDVSLKYDFQKKTGKKKFMKESSLVLGAFNVYYAKNPMNVSFKQKEDDPKVTEAQIMYMPIIPALTYNFKF